MNAKNICAKLKKTRLKRYIWQETKENKFEIKNKVCKELHEMYFRNNLKICVYEKTERK